MVGNTDTSDAPSDVIIPERDLSPKMPEMVSHIPRSVVQAASLTYRSGGSHRLQTLASTGRSSPPEKKNWAAPGATRIKDAEITTDTSKTPQQYQGSSPVSGVMNASKTTHENHEKDDMRSASPAYRKRKISSENVVTELERTDSGYQEGSTINYAPKHADDNFCAVSSSEAPKNFITRCPTASSPQNKTHPQQAFFILGRDDPSSRPKQAGCMEIIEANGSPVYAPHKVKANNFTEPQTEKDLREKTTDCMECQKQIQATDQLQKHQLTTYHDLNGNNHIKFDPRHDGKVTTEEEITATVKPFVMDSDSVHRPGSVGKTQDMMAEHDKMSLNSEISRQDSGFGSMISSGAGSIRSLDSIKREYIPKTEPILSSHSQNQNLYLPRNDSLYLPVKSDSIKTEPLDYSTQGHAEASTPMDTSPCPFPNVQAITGHIKPSPSPRHDSGVTVDSVPPRVGSADSVKPQTSSPKPPAWSSPREEASTPDSISQSSYKNINPNRLPPKKRRLFYEQDLSTTEPVSAPSPSMEQENTDPGCQSLPADFQQKAAVDLQKALLPAMIPGQVPAPMLMYPPMALPGHMNPMLLNQHKEAMMAHYLSGLTHDENGEIVHRSWPFMPQHPIPMQVHPAMYQQVMTEQLARISLQSSDSHPPSPLPLAMVQDPGNRNKGFIPHHPNHMVPPPQAKNVNLNTSSMPTIHENPRLAQNIPTVLSNENRNPANKTVSDPKNQFDFDQSKISFIAHGNHRDNGYHGNQDSERHQMMTSPHRDTNVQQTTTKSRDIHGNLNNTRPVEHSMTSHKNVTRISSPNSANREKHRSQHQEKNNKVSKNNNQAAPKSKDNNRNHNNHDNRNHGNTNNRNHGNTTNTNNRPSSANTSHPSSMADSERSEVKERSPEVKMATTPDEDGDLPLHIAVVQNEPDAIQVLVNVMKGADVSLDYHNLLKQTPLHLAVITKLEPIVRILLEAGASPNVPDRKGQTCCHLAVNNQTTGCLSALINHSTVKVDLNAKNYEGLTCLHRAVQLGDTASMEILLNHGADINMVDGKSGKSPLYLAFECNQPKSADLLLARGADVNIPTYSGSTVLQAANTRGQHLLNHLIGRVGGSEGSSHIKDFQNKLAAKVSRSRGKHSANNRANKDAATKKPTPRPQPPTNDNTPQQWTNNANTPPPQRINVIVQSPTGVASYKDVPVNNLSFPNINALQNPAKKRPELKEIRPAPAPMET